MNGLNSSSPEVTFAQNFLTQAQGQNALAVYLDGLPAPTQQHGFQGLIATESLDFTNLPAGPSSLSGFVYLDANYDGIKQPGEAPIPLTTITLTGINDRGLSSPKSPPPPMAPELIASPASSQATTRSPRPSPGSTSRETTRSGQSTAPPSATRTWSRRHQQSRPRPSRSGHQLQLWRATSS